MDFRRRLKYSIITLGCKVNQYESEAVGQALSQKGLEFCDAGLIRGKRLSPESAPDVCIINTCSVTQKAAMQSRQAIRRAVRANPEALVIVTGCYAQTQTSEIADIPGVHFIAGHAEKNGIISLVDSSRGIHHSPPKILKKDVNTLSVFQDMPATPSNQRTRSFLKIQDGCDAFCSYCIVPYARGRSRSLPVAEVLKKIRTLKESGAREIVLTGIHLGAYGKDLAENIGLYELLSKIREMNLIDRIRLSSVEPVELEDRIIALAAQWDGLCPHFHIPLQSGDNAVLKKMKRPYTGEFFENLVWKINDTIPDAAVGVDCLIGFPGENEQSFDKTYGLISELPAAYLHVFPFSPREGTPAWNFPGKVSRDIVKDRCARMRKLGEEKKKRFHEKFIGKKRIVLVEEQREPSTGLLKAMSDNYIPVLFQGDDALKNTLQTPTFTQLTTISGKSAVLGELGPQPANLNLV